MSVLYHNFGHKNVIKEPILGFSPLAVANEIIRRQPPGLTPMKLQKLIYFAHGWCLALSEQPLVTEDFQAWKYGPVLPTIWRTFNSYGGNVITQETPTVHTLGPKSKKLIDSIIRRYGHMSAMELSDQTHQTDSPWDLAWRRSPNTVITNDAIQNDFVALLKR